MNDADRGQHGDGRVLWGVPALPANRIAHPRLEARLEKWLRGSSILVVDAPAGFGKTVGVAGWLRERAYTHPVVWIDCGGMVGTARQIWETMIGAMGRLGLLPQREAAAALDGPADYSVLQDLAVPVIVVFDDVDRVESAPELDRVAHLARQTPLVRAIVIVSSIEDEGSISDTVDRVTIEASTLAWTAGMVSDFAESVYPAAAGRIDYRAITEATGGRPGALLHYLTVWDRAASENVGLGGRNARDIALEWSLTHLRTRKGGERVVTVFSLIALSIRMPADLLTTLMRDEPVGDAVATLLKDGLIMASRIPGDEFVSYEIPTQERELLQEYAATVLDGAIPGIHEQAARALEHRAPALAIHHYAGAGLYENAVALMKAVWSEVGEQISTPEFRIAASAIPDDFYRGDLEALAIRLLQSRLPPFDVQRRRDLETFLINVPASRLLSIPIERRILVVAAVVWGRLSRGKIREATALGVQLTRELEAGGLTEKAELAPALAVLWAQIAEAYLLAGRPRHGTEFTSRIRRLGVTDRLSFVRFRTTSLEALARAWSGELTAAQELIDEARRTYAAEDRPESESEYPLVFAESLVAHSHLDAEGLLRAGAWFRGFVNEAPRWRALVQLSEGYGLLYSGRAEAALTALRKAMPVVEQQEDLAIIDAMSQSLLSDLCVAVGRAGDAFDVLIDVPSTIGHSICLAVQRASAHLATGQPLLALADTDACIARGRDHSMRTLPSVILRRAIAQDQLGQGTAADELFLEFFTMMRRGPALSPYLNLSRSALATLFARFGQEHPESADEAVELWTGVESISHLLLSERAHGPLSTAELRILSLLQNKRTVSEIAAVLLVSPVTVRSQLSSIYRKLGVSTRIEAADIAAAMGLDPDAH